MERQDSGSLLLSGAVVHDGDRCEVRMADCDAEGQEVLRRISDDTRL